MEEKVIRKQVSFKFISRIVGIPILILFFSIYLLATGNGMGIKKYFAMLLITGLGLAFFAFVVFYFGKKLLSGTNTFIEGGKKESRGLIIVVTIMFGVLIIPTGWYLSRLIMDVPNIISPKVLNIKDYELRKGFYRRRFKEPQAYIDIVDASGDKVELEISSGVYDYIKKYGVESLTFKIYPHSRIIADLQCSCE